MVEKLIEQYNENEEQINKLHNKIVIERKKVYEKISQIKYDVYDKQIRELEHKRDDEVRQEETIFKEYEAEQKDKISILHQVVGQVDKILNLIDVLRNNYGTDFLVYTYSDKDDKGNYLRDKRRIIINPIEILQDDEFKKIAVYLVENDKPKNKYSLIVRGRTIFNDEDLGLLKFRYGSSFKGSDDKCNIELTLKELPTKEELIDWFNKNKQNILKEYLEQHKILEQEYKEALKLYELKDYKILFLEKQKDYYENYYRRGTETEEYKQIVKELQEVKNE